MRINRNQTMTMMIMMVFRILALVNMDFMAILVGLINIITIMDFTDTTEIQITHIRSPDMAIDIIMAAVIVVNRQTIVSINPEM